MFIDTKVPSSSAVYNQHKFLVDISNLYDRRLGQDRRTKRKYVPLIFFAISRYFFINAFLAMVNQITPAPYGSAKTIPDFVREIYRKQLTRWAEHRMQDQNLYPIPQTCGRPDKIRSAYIKPIRPSSTNNLPPGQPGLHRSVKMWDSLHQKRCMNWEKCKRKTTFGCSTCKFHSGMAVPLCNEGEYNCFQEFCYHKNEQLLGQPDYSFETHEPQPLSGNARRKCA